MRDGIQISERSYKIEGTNLTNMTVFVVVNVYDVERINNVLSRPENDRVQAAQKCFCV